MKKILCIFLAGLLLCNIAWGDCDWKKDVYKVDATHYSYTVGCHVQVGQNIQDLSNANITIAELNKSIALKNDALLVSDQRVQLWKTTSENLEDHLNKIERIERGNRWIYMGVGVIASGLAIYSVKQLKH